MIFSFFFNKSLSLVESCRFSVPYFGISVLCVTRGFRTISKSNLLMVRRSSFQLIRVIWQRSWNSPNVISLSRISSKAARMAISRSLVFWRSFLFWFSVDLFQGNVGLIFTKGDVKETREEIAKYKVDAPARVGLVAPVDVVIPVGNTGLDPSQTSFFQVLNIPTKTNKGTVEIITPVDLIKKGDKVGSSEASLLTKLSIKPFSYGLVVKKVFEDGSVYDPEVLDLTEDDLAAKFAAGLSNVVSIVLGVSYPTIAAAPHMFINGYKNVLSVAVATEYSFPLAEKVKEFLKDPSKFAAAVAVAAPAGGADTTDVSKEEKKEDQAEESEEEEGGLMGLFDD